MITSTFPEPGRLVRHALAQLQVARYGSDEEKAEQLGGLNPADLPRPWDPPGCPPTLRAQVWLWLDAVAGWINHDYTWQFDRTIPGCWPAHPHIAHELAALACLRLQAGVALAADPLEDWHRYALPTFIDRMSTRLGANSCPPGKHHDWPGGSRYKDYLSPAAAQRRRTAFDADTGLHHHGLDPEAESTPAPTAAGPGGGDGPSDPRETP